MMNIKESIIYSKILKLLTFIDLIIQKSKKSHFMHSIIIMTSLGLLTDLIYIIDYANRIRIRIITHNYGLIHLETIIEDIESFTVFYMLLLFLAFYPTVFITLVIKLVKYLHNKSIWVTSNFLLNNKIYDILYKILFFNIIISIIFAILLP